jgi:hypothetical protein
MSEKMINFGMLLTKKLSKYFKLKKYKISTVNEILSTKDINKIEEIKYQ